MQKIRNIEGFLTWVKSCPYKFTISSMQGGFIHVKFFIEEEVAPLEYTKDN
jgi:hypothetical protein